MKFHVLTSAIFAGCCVLCVGGMARAEQPSAASASPEATQAASKPGVAARTTPAELDRLLAQSAPEAAQLPPVVDHDFLRRASFDLIGRQPKLAEQEQFAADEAGVKHSQLVERLLASPEFGANWAAYWRDTIAFRIPPPELTYLNYSAFTSWLTAKLNANEPWDGVVRDLLTATGKLADEPAATFIGYHGADPTNLAGETSRIFLGQQISCAQCHDHPFDHWKRSQFHQLAAFFARTKSKLAQNDGLATVVSSAEKGEYLMPDMDDPRKKGTTMKPAVLGGVNLQAGRDDLERRRQLAAWVTSPENPWFAKAYTNRVWARLMGRGFFEPIDDLGDSRPQSLPQVHEALAAHFIASGYDVKDLFRLIMNTAAYRSGVRVTAHDVDPALLPAQAPLRLRGDEVFSALVAGIELPNVTPPAMKPTQEIRFPPPPKSTRDLVQDAFGNDPSLSPIDAPRTMQQALWMMNNEQLQAQINAAPNSGTMLSRLLEEQPDDREACIQLYSRVLARRPTEAELRLATAHLASLGNRQAAFEDLLWSLVNSAEFTIRR